jgi:hypothetical protein
MTSRARAKFIRRIHIVPRSDVDLYSDLVGRQNEIERRNHGTFYRVGRRWVERTKWRHRRYEGWINLQRGLGDSVIAELHWKSPGGRQWELLTAFVGFVDREFSTSVQSISVHYE